jgi:hypothetical protein
MEPRGAVRKWAAQHCDHEQIWEVESLMSPKINDGLTRWERYNQRHPKRRAEAAKRYRENHPEEDKARQLAYRQTEKGKQVRNAANRRYLYGSDGVEHFDAQRRLQRNRCAICRCLLVKACSDHNHKTKQRRGVLCDCCNRAIGLLKENNKTLKAAIQYLKRWETQWIKNNT